MTTHTDPLPLPLKPLKLNELKVGMIVYRQSTLSAPENGGYLQYKIKEIIPQEGSFTEINLVEETQTIIKVKGDETVQVFFPVSSGNKWHPIYASKGQYGGTRKNKRPTRKNKRPTRRGRRRASCI